jgi:ADP-ribose pyrophosphatase YjhB (NUDIX family)
VTHPLTTEEFDAIYARVPRLTVEVILRDHRGVFLTRRDSGPCAGRWHIPGGTVRFAEPLHQAVERVARDKLGVTVTASRHAGFIEYPSHYLEGTDTPVGAAFEADWDGDPVPVAGALDAGWFTAAPDGMHDEQARFLGWHTQDDPAGTPGRAT